jgi:hypothetical protein
MRKFDAIWHHNGTTFVDVTESLGDGSAPLALAAGEKLYMGYRDWLSGIYTRISQAPSNPNIAVDMYDGVTNAWRSLALPEKFNQLALGHSLAPAFGFDKDGVVYWGEAQWQWVLKRAVTANFPEQAGTVPGGLQLYWIRLRNAGTDAVTFNRLIPLPYNTYAVHQDVARFLGMAEFDDVRDPLASYVRAQIAGAEDWLDNYCRRTWRIRGYWNEHYDFNPYGFVTKHRPIIEVMRLGFWQGSHFQDMTEGRGQDWFATPEKGLVRFTLPSFQLRYYSFLLSRYLRQPDSVEIDYVAGSDFDVHDQREEVRQIILRKVGADIVNQQDWARRLVNNPDSVPKAERARKWEEEAYTRADVLRAPLIV